MAPGIEIRRSRWRRVVRALRDPWVRTLLAVVLLALAAFLLRDQKHFLAEGWATLARANNWYLAGAVIAMALAMVTQAEVMVVLLRTAGVRVARGVANALGLAANSWSLTFPGGPAISAAMIFREQLKWGATPVIASWYMVLSGALSAGGMALLGLGAVFFLGARVQPLTLAISLLVLVVLAWATNWAATHPRAVERRLLAALTAFNRRRGAADDRWHDRIRAFTEQLSAVQLPLPRLTLAMVWSLLNWIAEIACLLLAIEAVGGTPPVAAVVLTFLAAKLVGQAPVTPGGLGPVDLALTTMLVSVGAMPSADALAAVILFRMVSFALPAVVGWLVFLAMFIARSHRGGTRRRGEA
ncbi:lysylphosphatidylglycerol synthase transmembrane domain-containing protein [Corynebacterium bovis]|uniref:TIGR00374 family protein n=1 Tax=Corynebacterium bovis TaxID=36808 RepID=A0A3R8RGY0_9CORY|nr:YbhN family protein [Corynebacterium bovis]RRO90868.1 hypothetical protein CXF40_07855 [Corynebacterium bovis]RRO96341.1 hypothetical protein CXF31_07665 [Corynebacterium bovis]RRO96556.1 hypothetical protein CXF32_05840 [Corynebacterium bovis]RRO99171.1 hypothetical protein CXF41_10455 [Corynebacterium bovis]RRQ00548.1 hypothetical protein CXF39_08600 [Corynebacterium bovis]